MFYTDLSRNYSNDTLLGTITCSSRNSPPAYVGWSKDGVPIVLDGDRYEMIKTVIDRAYRRSYYDSVLLIRDAVGHAGNHTYKCGIANYVWAHHQTISTNMTGNHNYHNFSF